MGNTRYEEHEYFGHELPFTLIVDIKRSHDNYTKEANWHNNIELEWIKNGSGFILLDGKRVNVTANDIVLVNSNVIHHLIPKNDIKYSCLILGYDFCLQAEIDYTKLVFSEIIHSDELIKLFLELEQVYQITDDVCKTAKLKIIVLNILIMLRSQFTIKQEKSINQFRSLDRIKKTILYIRENYNKKLTLDELSQNVYVDKFLLSREFKQITGQTIIEYINSYKCKIAANYISNGTPVLEAARLCGFNNMSFFTKTFKKYFKTLPSKIK